MIESPVWAPHRDVTNLLPGASLPALVEQGPEGRVVACGTHSICEHLEESCPSPRLLLAGRADRAEARRVWARIEGALAEVNESLLAERISQWVRRDRQPDSAALRAGAHALRGQLTFLNALAEMRGHLAGRQMSLADLCAAAHLSAYDYFGDVEWDAVPDLKLWYGRMKSRPSFRGLLADRLDAVRPAQHYADLDF